jgi:biopolymer transport protein TolR
MAFGRLERTRAPRPMSDINMTPLIDVMLVLMVLFMLAAPLIASSLKLELPASDAATSSEAGDVISIAVDAKGQLYWGEEALAPEPFASRLADAARTQSQAEVQLRADRAVPYGKVAELIGALQKAGLTRIGLVTESAAADSSPASEGVRK